MPVEPQTKHLPADERRAVIIESVIALAGSQPPGTITTAAIAGHMRLTQGALFRHFASKDAILQAVMEWVAERLLSRVDKAIADAASPVVALEAVFMAHVSFVSEHAGVPRLMFSELQGAPQSARKRLVQTLLRGYGERLHRLLEAGKAQGELDAALDTAAAANLFIGTIQGLVMQSLLLGDAGLVRQRAPGVFAIYLRGIRKSP
jgi:AcrR family transcriptional regulator